MATESTLLIVKPDGVRRGLVGEVLRRVEAKGLAIDEMRLFTIPRETAEEHYGEHRDKPFFGELVDFITSGPVVVAQDHGRRRDHLLAHPDGSDEPGRGAARVDPRRLRDRDRREHRARQRLPRVGRARARPLLRRLSRADRPWLACRRPSTASARALEHHLESSHAAGRGARGHRRRGDPRRRRCAASPTSPPARRCEPRPASRSARSRSRSPASSRCRRPRRAGSTCT